MSTKWTCFCHWLVQIIFMDNIMERSFKEIKYFSSVLLVNVSDQISCYEILWKLSCCRKTVVETWVRVGERSTRKSLLCLSIESVVMCSLVISKRSSKCNFNNNSILSRLRNDYRMRSILYMCLKTFPEQIFKSGLNSNHMCSERGECSYRVVNSASQYHLCIII